MQWFSAGPTCDNTAKYDICIFNLKTALKIKLKSAICSLEAASRYKNPQTRSAINPAYKLITWFQVQGYLAQ